MENFKKIFRGLQDPRAANAVHDVLDILFIALAAVLCGAKGATDMALFGRSKEKLLRQVLRLEHGIPSHDTFGRVFGALDPHAFEAVFRQFMAAFAAANRLDLTGVVAVDGKALRGAYERGKRSTPLQMVNVFAAQARMALASRKAPGRNEAKAAVDVLRLLSLDGCIVTADALHCHRAFAATALERGADYALALKQNQGKLFKSVARRFTRGGKRSVAKRVEPSTHDRHEARRATVIRDPGLAAATGFPGLAALGRITSRRRRRGERAEKPDVRYFLLSKAISAKRLLHVVRSHWGIENRLHWLLDVVFDEDRSRARKDNGPENLAILRRLALNVIRAHPPKPPCARKSNGPVGTMPSFSISSATCDSPAHQGGFDGASGEGSKVAPLSDEEARMEPAVKLFWQPGCTSCLRTKEFLIRRGVPFQSVNVHDDAGGWEELQRLGPRSVPVVSKGDRFVFAQVLDDVAKFLGLELKEDRLAPAALAERLDGILTVAKAGVTALPDEALESTLPGRNRSYRALGYHIFRIPEAFLEALDRGEKLVPERVNLLPGEEIKTGADIARYGEGVRARFKAWWESAPDAQRPMDTYYGSRPLHLVLERTVWHSTQHTRQLEMVLGMLDVPVPSPLTPALLKGLPLPENVWG